MGANRPDPSAVRQLLKLAGAPAGGHATDRELIARFVADRSEAAFADLMARHGPMVLGVCRRHLRDRHAADDAFQATFIVLARRAGAVRWRESVGGWLFEVATRVARKAAVRTARRSSREGTPTDAAPEPAAPPATPPADLSALQAALDEELAKLPERLRAPVVLCHLEGLSQAEVARHLGVSDGQLRGRLYRAKEKLRENLLRRGFALTAVLLALNVAGTAQALPAVLAAGTLRLATASTDVIPVAILKLTQGVIQDMTFSTKLFAVLALFGVLGFGAAGVATHAALAGAPDRAAAITTAPATRPLVGPNPLVQPIRRDDEAKKPEDKADRVGGTIKAIPAEKNTLRVKIDEADTETDIVVPATAKVTFGKKPAMLADLKPGMHVEFVYVGEATAPTEVHARWPKTEAKAKAVDAAKNTITIAVENGGVDFDIPLTVAADAEVKVDGLPAGLADVAVGLKVALELGLDKKTVLAVRADGEKGDIPAVVKSYDPAARTLLIEFEIDANDVNRHVTLALAVNADAKVRLAGKDAKLSDLKERMPVRLRMTADRKAVASILAGDPLPVSKDDD